MDGYTGEIRIFAFSYAPLYWAYCDGSRIAISQNQALSAIIQNLYGGDLRTYFNLPNLQNQIPMGTGAGPGLTPRTIANTVGTETVTLKSSDLPQHDHTLQAYTAPTATSTYIGTPSATTRLAVGQVGGKTPIQAYNKTQAPNTTLAPNAVTVAGGTTSGSITAHENRQPYLVLNFCICTDGVFPVREQ